MKIIRLKESQLKLIIENVIKEEMVPGIPDEIRRQAEDDFLENYLSKLKRIRYKREDIILWVDKNRSKYIKYDKSRKDLWIYYNSLWSKFKSKYSFNYQQLSNLFKWLMETHEGLDVHFGADSTRTPDDF